MIECRTLDGQKKSVPKDSLVFRPAAYAIVVQDNKILLMRMRHTGKYHPPGGGIEIGEHIEDTLRRELREETGIEIEIERFACFHELFFYYDPSGRAYHGLHFYYICRPKTLTLVDNSHVDDHAAEQPRWVSIDGLQAQDFQAHGEVVVALCREIGEADKNTL